MSEFTFGSLFAGIGGIDLGLERAGMICKWQVEIDEYCQKVLAKHWPNVRRYEDVREVGKHNLHPVDLIAGGFPCQPHSVAGKRKGADDDRNLWPEYRRIVAELRPRWVVGENVPGIVTTYLDTVLSDLEGEGYTCVPLNIPACGFDAPHRRERIFVVAHALSQSGRCIKGFDTEKEPFYTAQRQKSHATIKRGGQAVAHAECDDNGRSDGPGWRSRESGKAPRDGSYRGGRAPNGYWLPEPQLGRVAYGIPNRVDRLRALGNAVVPQVAEWIGRRILEAAS